MERKTPFVEGENYHVYNRGVEKRPLFISDADSQRFQYLLYLCNSRNPIIYKTIQGLPLDKQRGDTIVNIYAYSLMPNHFHLLIGEKEIGGLSRFMNKLQTAYSMYFNKKYERTGSLFGGPFKGKHVNSNEYMQWVFSYIHANPLDIIDYGWKERGLEDVSRAGYFMQSYKYSSYPDYFVEERPESKILDKSSLPIESLDTYDLEKLLALSKGNPWINKMGII